MMNILSMRCSRKSKGSVTFNQNHSMPGILEKEASALPPNDWAVPQSFGFLELSMVALIVPPVMLIP